MLARDAEAQGGVPSGPRLVRAGSGITTAGAFGNSALPGCDARRGALIRSRGACSHTLRACGVSVSATAGKRWEVPAASRGEGWARGDPRSVARAARLTALRDTLGADTRRPFCVLWLIWRCCRLLRGRARTAVASGGRERRAFTDKRDAASTDIWASDSAESSDAGEGGANAAGSADGAARPKTAAMEVPKRVRSMPAALLARARTPSAVGGVRPLGHKGAHERCGSAGDGPPRPGSAASGRRGSRPSTASGRCEISAWGWGAFGQCGVASKDDVQRPTPVAVFDRSEAGVVAVGAGSCHTLAATRTGAVFAWGRNNWGQLGLGPPLGDGRCAPEQLSPREVPALRHVRVTAVACGGFHSLALTAGGRVLAWGRGSAGQLGLVTRHEVAADSGLAMKPLGDDGRHANGDGGGTANAVLRRSDLAAFSLRPVEVAHEPRVLPEPQRVTMLAAGLHHSAAVTSDGKLWTWGEGRRGQLGSGTLTQALLPACRALPAECALSPVVDVACGDSHSLAVVKTGSVVGAGDSSYGRLGLTDAQLKRHCLSGRGELDTSNSAAHSSPPRVPERESPSRQAAAVSPAPEGADDEDGRPVLHTFVQLPTFSLENRRRAQAGARSSVGGSEHSPTSLDVDGGDDAAGEDEGGGGESSESSSDDLRPGSSRSSHSRSRSGSGKSARGRRHTAKKVAKVVSVCAGGASSGAVTEEGQLFVWGTNDSGELGLGHFAAQRTPVVVPAFGGTGRIQIATAAMGQDHVVALSTTGNVYTWGRVACGRLGASAADLGKARAAAASGRAPDSSDARRQAVPFLLHSFTISSTRGTAVAVGGAHTVVSSMPPHMAGASAEDTPTAPQRCVAWGDGVGTAPPRAGGLALLESRCDVDGNDAGGGRAPGTPRAEEWASFIVEARDTDDRARAIGGDLVEVVATLEEATTGLAWRSLASNASRKAEVGAASGATAAETRVRDNGDGTYTAWYLPHIMGRWHIDVHVTAQRSPGGHSPVPDTDGNSARGRIRGAPFAVTALPPAAPPEEAEEADLFQRAPRVAAVTLCSARGRALRTMMVGQRARVKVEVRDARTNELMPAEGVSFRGVLRPGTPEPAADGGEERKIGVVDGIDGADGTVEAVARSVGDGTWHVDIVPVRAGASALSVYLESGPSTYPIKGSPWDVQVSPGAAVAERCTASGAGLQATVFALQPWSFIIVSRDEHGNVRDRARDSFTVSVDTVADGVGDDSGSSNGGEGGGGDEPDVHRNDAGTYDVTYVPRRVGKHYITVMHRRRHINGSPFAVIVEEAPYLPPDAARCRIDGDDSATRGAVAGEWARVCVAPVDALGRPLDASEWTTPKDTPFDVRLQPIATTAGKKPLTRLVPVEGGRLAVEYQAHAPGDYMLHISVAATPALEGAPLPGFPRRVVVACGAALQFRQNGRVSAQQRIDDGFHYVPSAHIGEPEQDQGGEGGAGVALAISAGSPVTWFGGLPSLNLPEGGRRVLHRSGDVSAEEAMACVGAVVVDRQRDKLLADMLARARALVGGVDSCPAPVWVQLLALWASDCCGGPLDDAPQAAHVAEEGASTLPLAGSVVYLGELVLFMRRQALRGGGPAALRSALASWQGLHRAVLFKVACDEVGVPCELSCGDGGVAASVRDAASGVALLPDLCGGAHVVSGLRAAMSAPGGAADKPAAGGRGGGGGKTRPSQWR